MPTTRIFKMRRPSAVPTSRLPALRESATALLRVLSNGNPSTQDIARCISFDPVLVFELLLTAPLGGNEPEKLLDAIANRVAGIDAGLLQGWSLRHVIQQPHRRIGARSHRHHALHSQFVAELSLHLALETTYPRPDEAYCAGLMHDLGLLWLGEYSDDYRQIQLDAIDERALAAAEWERYGFDHAELSADLAARCGFPPSVADAIALHQAEPEGILNAHPLVRILAAAEELAGYRGSQSAASLESASRLTGIEGSLLVSLIADTARSLQDRLKGLEMSIEPAMLTQPWAISADKSEPAVDTSIARTALGAFARGAFSNGGMARQGFDLASRLLLGLDAPVLFVRNFSEDFLVGAANPVHPGLEQLQIPVTDEYSTLAQAFRDDTEMRFQNGARPAGAPPTGSSPAGSNPTACSVCPGTTPTKPASPSSPAPATRSRVTTSSPACAAPSPRLQPPACPSAAPTRGCARTSRTASPAAMSTTPGASLTRPATRSPSSRPTSG